MQINLEELNAWDLSCRAETCL